VDEATRKHAVTRAGSAPRHTIESFREALYVAIVRLLGRGADGADTRMGTVRVEPHGVRVGDRSGCGARRKRQWDASMRSETVRGIRDADAIHQGG
jgi:hypothetical protein